jgi:23S rRNA pseudouridine1911/1915/1917 synthase
MPDRRWTIADTDAGTRLDKWLAASGRCGSRARALAALGSGKVFVGEHEAGRNDSGRALVAGDVVRLWDDRPGSASRRGARRIGDLDIVFEDDALIVVNKPPGVLSVPLDAAGEEPSMKDLVAAHWRSHAREPLVVHRIDRDTSGLVVFARSREASQALKAQFLRRDAERLYLALVEGVPVPAEGTWRDWLSWDDRALHQRVVPARRARAVEAVTRYRAVETFAGAALVELALVTGRQHQIRAQAAAHGHPLVGERMYRDVPAVVDAPRQMLHAARLGLEHPRSRQRLTLESRPPSDFRKLVARLRVPGPDRAAAGRRGR